MSERKQVDMSMLKAVIFDLDGTLLNRDESVKLFIESQYIRLKESLGHIPREKYVTRFLELDERGYVWKDKVYQQLVDEFEITGATWEELLQDYKSKFQDNCIPFPNLSNMLEELKAHSLLLGMITNGYGQFQMDNIKALGIEKYFDVILVSEWEGVKKPDPAIFLKACEKLNVTPGECVFVGDHPENDVKAARDVGMVSVWKKDSQWSEVPADYIVEDFKELPAILSDLTQRYSDMQFMPE